MKKNFLMVASLLIAAMLLVVSCSQEVKAPENELVETTIGLAYGKDVTVGYTDNSSIVYKYELKHLWTDLNNGAPIYGETNGEVYVYTNESGNAVAKKLTDNLDPFNSNYVTPGYWEVTVNGYSNNKKILTGSTKVYFNKTNSNATVYVSPLTNSEVTGNVTITLVMEDLDLGDTNETGASKVKYTIDNGSASAIDRVAKANTSDENKSYVENQAAHEYNITLTNVQAGYHTITISVEGYTGGVTKSFLMIPGNNVAIKGSVYPSEFNNSISSIKVVTLRPVVLSINDTAFSSGSVEPVTVTKGTTYTASMADFSYTGLTGSFTYTWYVDGVKQGSVEKPINGKTAILTAPNVPGDYTVTCVAMLTATDDAGVTHVLYGGEEFAGKIRVEASNKTASSSN